VIPIVADTMSSESVAHLVDGTLAAFGRVDVLVNNASTPGGMVRGPLAEADDKTLLEDIDTKVSATPVRQGGGASHAAAPLGRIVTSAGSPGDGPGTSAGCAMPLSCIDQDTGGRAWGSRDHRELGASRADANGTY